jgi:hypothetical protein
MAEGERFEHGSVLGGKVVLLGSALSGNQHEVANFLVECIGGQEIGSLLSLSSLAIRPEIVDSDCKHGFWGVVTELTRILGDVSGDDEEISGGHGACVRC